MKVVNKFQVRMQTYKIVQKEIQLLIRKLSNLQYWSNTLTAQMELNFSKIKQPSKLWLRRLNTQLRIKGVKLI